ncbi:MAG: 50S ribosomal protein L5 [bacterium]|nr:50S ribosomal protein L5 [bacterium]
MKTVKEKNNNAFEVLKDTLGLKNKMQAPRLVKVIVSSGIGSQKDKKKIELIGDRLGKITGQKPAVRGAKQSISNFKSRQGDPVGYQITIRGKRMYDFLDRLLNVALPRTRDFRGISARSLDDMGNYTIGIKEHTIFPETTDEDIKDIFGMAITVVTTSQDKKQTKAFLDHLGFPFKKADVDVREVSEKKKK